MYFHFFILTLFLIGCSTAVKKPQAVKLTPSTQDPKTPAPLVPTASSIEQAENIALNKKVIQQVIKKKNKYISNCYGQTLTTKGNEHLKGTLMIGFDIDPNGKAHAAKVIANRSSLKNEDLGECLILGLKKWRFPIKTDNADVTVNYPFVFREQTPKNMQNKLDQFQKIIKTR